MTVGVTSTKSPIACKRITFRFVCDETHAQIDEPCATKWGLKSLHFGNVADKKRGRFTRPMVCRRSKSVLVRAS